MNKKNLLDLAEIIDAWRVIPRVLVAGYAWLMWQICDWYMMLEQPVTQHSILITAVLGVAGAIFSFYTSTGTKWTK